jgi:hypothetical protein
MSKLLCFQTTVLEVMDVQTTSKPLYYYSNY